MALTLSTMQTRVRRVIRDANSDFISDAEITDVLNEAQTDLATRLRCIQASTTSTTSGNTISLPANYLEVESLRIGSDDVEFVNRDEWQSWSDSGATPEVPVARVFASTFEIYPTPTTGTTYVLRYFKTPTALSGASDEPEVNDELQLKMLDYGRSYAFEKDGNLEMAVHHKQKYEDGLPQPPGVTNDFTPGPITLSYSAGPFDTADAKHI